MILKFKKIIDLDKGIVEVDDQEIIDYLNNRNSCIVHIHNPKTLLCSCGHRYEEPKKVPLFVTKDGVDIFEGDKFYTIDSNFKIQFTFGGEDEVNNAWFNKEKAEEYILINKPCLSINDVLSFTFPQSLDRQLFTGGLKKIVKSKL